MNDVDETCSLTSFESFRSALSRGEDEVSLLSFADDEEQTAFLLDVDELERVGSLAKGGVPCRLRKTENFERATYFHFRAEFIDRTAWDVIVPHSPRLHMRFQGAQDISLPKVCPKLMAWQLGHGMGYIFVKTIRGFEDWEYPQWIRLAKAKEARISEPSSPASPTSSQIPSIMSSTNESTPRTTDEMNRSELSRTSSRSRKSVRFDIDETPTSELVKYEPPISLMTRLRQDTIRRLKQIKHYIRTAKRKVDRPLIGFLMRCGY